MRKKRVAVFTDSFDQINGVSNTLKQLVRYCCEHQYPIDLHTYSRRQSSVETLGSVRILRHKPFLPVPYYSDMFWDLQTPRTGLLKDLPPGACDLIHVATPGSMGLNGLWLAHHNKIPLLGSYHTALPEYVRPRVENFARRVRLPAQIADRAEAAVWRYVQWFYNQCQRVLVPSRSTWSLLETRLRTPLALFSRGVDVDRFHPRFRRPPARITALYVGRVSIEKDLDLLVRLFRQRRDVDLVIAGDGPYRNELRRLLPRAILPGFLAGEELSQAYASADVFLFPSKTDTFGNAVLEAMSSGVPAIVTDQMGPKELIRHGEDGFVASNEWEFRRCLEALIDRPSLRQAMGQSARKSALSRSWSAVFAQLFQQYNEVAEAVPSELPSSLNSGLSQTLRPEAHGHSFPETTKAASH